MIPSLSESPRKLYSSLASLKIWEPDGPSFKDRLDAGRQLGEKLIELYGEEILQDALYLGCVRSGMGIAEGVIEKIKAKGWAFTLDCMIVQKLRLPDNKGCGIGALTETGDPIFLQFLVDRYEADIKSRSMDKYVQFQQTELADRQKMYRQGRKLTIPPNKTVVIIDDGIAKGETMVAAIKSVQTLCPEVSRIIIAAPLAHINAEKTIANYTGINAKDICILEKFSPPAHHYWNLDSFYHIFDDVCEKEVLSILENSNSRD